MTSTSRRTITVTLLKISFRMLLLHSAAWEKLLPILKMCLYFKSLFWNKSRQTKKQDDSDVGLLCTMWLSCLGILLSFARCCCGFCNKTRWTDLSRIILMKTKNWNYGLGRNPTWLGSLKIRSWPHMLKQTHPGFITRVFTLSHLTQDKSKWSDTSKIHCVPTNFGATRIIFISSENFCTKCDENWKKKSGLLNMIVSCVAKLLR